jgi:hypothetical protein
LVKVEWVSNTGDLNEDIKEQKRLKVLNDDCKTRGQTFFIPVNSRITLGRDDHNDVKLEERLSAMTTACCLDFIADSSPINTRS